MLCQLGLTHLLQSVAGRLAGWLSFCRDGLRQYEGGIALIDQFISTVIDRVDNVLHNK